MTPLDRLADVAPVFVIFPVFAYMLKMILEYSTRKKMIEKGLMGEDAVKIFQANTAGTNLPSSLKWGLVLLFVGVVIVVLQALPSYVSSEIYFGVMLMAAGVAMLIYYGLALMKEKEKKNNKNE